MFESCCLPYRIQSTAAHISAFPQTDGKVEPSQEILVKQEKLWVPGTAVSKIYLERPLFLYIHQSAALLLPLNVGGYMAEEGAAPI